MNVYSFLSAFVLCGVTATASAQFAGNSGVQVNIGGQYSKTSYSGNRNNRSVSNYSVGGNISVGGVSSYVGGGVYGGGYPVNCTPVYVPYSPFTGTYGNPCYPNAVVLPNYGGCVPIYPMCNGQFIIN